MQTQINRLVKEAEKYRVNAPVTVIGSEELAKKYMNKVAQKKKAGTYLLFGEYCNAAELDQFLVTQNFCAKNGDYHKVHFVLKDGGIGIDYPSTAAINNAGGNVVIICIKPTSYSQLMQFKRRTARMGAPGTVVYILIGNNNGEDPHYLQALEGALKENDLQNILHLSNKLNSGVYSEVEPWQGQPLFRLENNGINKDQDVEEYQKGEAKNDFGIKQNDLQMVDQDVNAIQKSVQIQPVIDSKDHQHTDIKMNQTECRNDKIKLKVYGSKIYLNKNDWQAYQEGKKTAKGRAIPDYQKLDQEIKETPYYQSTFFQEKRDTQPNKRQSEQKKERSQPGKENVKKRNQKQNDKVNSEKSTPRKPLTGTISQQKNATALDDLPSTRALRKRLQ